MWLQLILVCEEILTYMSIRAIIKSALEATPPRLIQLLPAIDGDPVVRTMLLSPELDSLLLGPWVTPTIERRCNRLRADLEVFVKGEEVQVCLEPYVHDTALFGRLDKPGDEVWDIRSRAPKPGLRVFGRFAETDVFVALTCAPRSVEQIWLDRKALKDRTSIQWHLNIIECHERWEKLFPEHPPVHGDFLHAYLTNAVYV
jgi:hypothetical protein